MDAEQIPSPHTHTSPTHKDGNSESRPRRKQVKRACSNCKLAHAACESNRPCSRCISKGIQSSCKEWDTPHEDHHHYHGDGDHHLPKKRTIDQIKTPSSFGWEFEGPVLSNLDSSQEIEHYQSCTPLLPLLPPLSPKHKILHSDDERDGPHNILQDTWPPSPLPGPSAEHPPSLGLSLNSSLSSVPPPAMYDSPSPVSQYSDIQSLRQEIDSLRNKNKELEKLVHQGYPPAQQLSNSGPSHRKRVSPTYSFSPVYNQASPASHSPLSSTSHTHIPSHSSAPVMQHHHPHQHPVHPLHHGSSLSPHIPDIDLSSIMSNFPSVLPQQQQQQQQQSVYSHNSGLRSQSTDSLNPLLDDSVPLQPLFSPLSSASPIGIPGEYTSAGGGGRTGPTGMFGRPVTPILESSEALLRESSFLFNNSDSDHLVAVSCWLVTNIKCADDWRLLECNSAFLQLIDLPIENLSSTFSYLSLVPSRFQASASQLLRYIIHSGESLATAKTLWVKPDSEEICVSTRFQIYKRSNGSSQNSSDSEDFCDTHAEFSRAGEIGDFRNHIGLHDWHHHSGNDFNRTHHRDHSNPNELSSARIVWAEHETVMNYDNVVRLGDTLHHPTFLKYSSPRL